MKTLSAVLASWMSLASLALADTKSGQFVRRHGSYESSKNGNMAGSRVVATARMTNNGSDVMETSGTLRANIMLQSLYSEACRVQFNSADSKGARTFSISVSLAGNAVLSLNQNMRGYRVDLDNNGTADIEVTERVAKQTTRTTL